MQYFFLFTLLFFLSCNKEESGTSASQGPKKVISIEDEIGSFTFIPNVQGIEIKGERISREGNLTTGEDLKFVEKSSSKVIDEFLSKDWGKVGFKVEEGNIFAYPVKDIFEIKYSIKNKKAVRESSCSFKNIPDDSKFDSLISEASKTNADLETIISGLSDLAKQGHKKSHDFFLAPDTSAKEVLKKTEDGGESIVKVLSLMAKSGCKW
jgi:hypothetical protein